MNLHSLCKDIEQFLQQNDHNSKAQFLNWLKSRLNIPTDETDHKSLINTSQLFSCQCGHQYSLRVAITDNFQEHERFDFCTKCQIDLHDHESYRKHYSMHQQGQLFCKCCLQFYTNEEMETHDCEQGKFNELQSLEQLIPPDTNEQEQESNLMGKIHDISLEKDASRYIQLEFVNDADTSTSARLVHLGLPKLTDSITEIRHPDGKRQFRCPICSNSYVNRSGLNRHYITHSSQDFWKVGSYEIFLFGLYSRRETSLAECQYCGKRYSRKDSLKHHMKTQHAQMTMPSRTLSKSNSTFYQQSNEKLYQSHRKLSSNSINLESALSNEKEHDDVVLIN
ncbi:unnamed protein product [Adineta ricciae]|uniref:C2H2-type domain-containing protein n=1 Tax=Adineta ricciae TaxID=249248 RepID=A0A814HGN1_ADIRI|nr:unnamed protein product [Adineta ricciae]